MASFSHIWNKPRLHALQVPMIISQPSEIETSDDWLTTQLAQLFKYDLERSSLPSCPPCQGAPTRSPIFHFFSPGPKATTSPIVSWPGIRGLESQSQVQSCRKRENVGGSKYKEFIAPACTPASEWQTPVARTLMRIWPSPGCRSSTSSRVSGAFASLKSAALNVFGRLGAMPRVDFGDCSGEKMPVSNYSKWKIGAHVGEDEDLYSASQIGIQVGSNMLSDGSSTTARSSVSVHEEGQEGHGVTDRSTDVSCTY